MQIVKKSHQYTCKCTQFKEKSQDLVSRRAHLKRSIATPHFCSWMLRNVVLGGFGWLWVVLASFGWFWVVPYVLVTTAKRFP